MNYKIFPWLMLLALLINACGNKQTIDQESATAKQSSQISTAAQDPEMKQEAAPEIAMTSQAVKMDRATLFELLRGDWMSDTYLAEIEKTKSVLAGSKVVKGMLGFNILTDKENGEALSMYDYSAHEGGARTVLVWNEEQKTFGAEKNYTHSHTSEGIYLHLISEDLIEASFEGERPPERYRRAKNPDALNKILFTGVYMHYNQQVKFLPDGRIERDPDVYEFSEYTVGQDFFGCEMDRIYLTTEMGDFEAHYKFKAEKIELYHFNFIHEGNCEYTEFHSELIKQGDLEESYAEMGASANSSNPYYDLPREIEHEFINMLQTNNDLSWSQKTKDILLDFINKTVLSGHSQFGSFISSNYFWHVYNALPVFVAEKERHNGYYKGESNHNLAERLKAYALYRMDRSPENISHLFDKVKPQLTTILPPESYHRMQIGEKLRALDLAHQELTAIDNYQQKLDEFYDRVYTERGEVKVEGNPEVKKRWENGAYSFASYEVAEMLCHELGIDRYSAVYGSTDLTFWMRRQHEGNFEMVYEILKEIYELYQ